jgi:hypothetical protein
MAVIAISVAAAVAVIALSGLGAELPLSAMAGAVGMLVMQAMAVALTWLLARARGGKATDVLALARVPSWRSIAAALGGMMALLVPLNALIFAFARDTVVEDLKPFQDTILSSAGPVYGLVLAFGAPLSEEFLFRGFLQSALAGTPLGFVGATLVTTTAWAALHAGYSWIGLAEVFLIGLYFAYLLWRTGSLWPALICHAVYNGALFVAMRFYPFAL